MCGIAGFIAREPDRQLERARTLEQMLEALRHRGPDGTGLWRDPSGFAALGHRRLAIIDPSPTGGQPMEDAEGRWVLSLNGEIYNYVELRSELEHAGVKFRGTSDTEVLLAACARWGIDQALERAVGMFAFAAWEDDRRVLHLARDRVGKKPLYYARMGAALWFASEIKALCKIGRGPLPIDGEAIYHYLSLGFIPGPGTVYRGVEEVPPGHRLEVNAALDVRCHRYWRLPTKARRHVSFAEIVENVELRLKTAVTERLRADVTVGVFLSGGVDSGLITAIAAQQTGAPLKTFTVGLDSPDLDESRLAARMATRYRTDHSELRVGDRIEDLLLDVSRTYDEPFADPSAVPTFALAREAARSVKVVLNGEGGDELFGGYRRHLAARYFGPLERLTGGIGVAGLRRIGEVLPRSRGSRTPYTFLQRALRGLDVDPYARYVSWSSDGFDEHEKHRLLRSAPSAARSTTTYLSERFTDLKALPSLDHLAALDFLLAMPDCLLVKLDMATMAHGLEARCPFLDHRLVEWVGHIARSRVFGRLDTKPVLRALARKYLPADVVTAPKRGFEVPVKRWMREDLNQMARDLCLREGGIVLELCDRKQVTRLIEGQTGLDEDRWAKRLWLLLMLALWDLRGR
jgi:asparagine synthase (glutamine-hydrolysing)